MSKALSSAESKRKQLVEQKKALLREIADIDDQIGQVDRFIKAYHAFAEDDDESAVDNLLSSNENKESASRPVKRSSVQNSKKEEVADVALEIIRQRGEPVGRADLYKALIDRGLTIDGSDPEMVLSTMLWRMKHRVVRLKAGGYWIAGTDLPDAGYFPSRDSDILNLIG